MTSHNPQKLNKKIEYAATFVQKVTILLRTVDLIQKTTISWNAHLWKVEDAINNNIYITIIRDGRKIHLANGNISMGDKLDKTIIVKI